MNFIKYLRSGWVHLMKRKGFTLLHITAIGTGLMLLLVFVGFYSMSTAPIAPEVNKDRCLYLQQCHFMTEDGKMVSEKEVFYYMGKVRRLSAKMYKDWFKKMETPEATGVYSIPLQINLGSKIAPIEKRYLYVDEGFWKIMDFSFLKGHPFSVEQVNQKAKVVVITDALAQQFFSEKDPIGQYLTLKKEKYQIVGVVGSIWPYSEVYADIYVPFVEMRPWMQELPSSGMRYDVNAGNYNMVVMAGEKSDFNRIRKEFQNVISRINAQGEADEFAGIQAKLTGPSEVFMTRLKGPDLGLTIVAIYLSLILIPLFILMQINLSRLKERYEEIGIRRSFGAPRKAILNQFLAENLLVTLFGGVFGGVVAYYGFGFFMELIFPESENVYLQVNATWVGVGVMCVFVFSFLTGILPAWRMSRAQVVEALEADKL